MCGSVVKMWLAWSAASKLTTASREFVLRRKESRVDAAIASAVEREWLIAEGNPAHSICLTEAGECGLLGA
jgi:hypothetical protein